MFKNHTPRQTIAKNTFWLSVSNAGGRLCRSLIIIYAARVLGTEGWGAFSYAITLAAFLTLFVDFGINVVLIKEASRTEDRSRYKEMLSTSFYMKLVFLALGILLILFLGPYLSKNPEVKAILPLVAAIMAFDTLRQFGFSVNQALERMERETALFLLTNVAIVGAGFIFLALHTSVISFASAYALGTGLGAAATYAVLRKDLQGVLGNFSMKLLRPIFSASWPFAISSLLGVLMINTDILLIGWIRGISDVGLYSAGNRVIQVLYILPAILGTSALPTFSRLAMKDDHKMRSAFEQIVSFSFLAALPAAIGGFLVAPRLLPFLFGSSYEPGIHAFQILLLTILIDFPAVIIANAVVSYDKQRALIKYSLIGGLSNVILDLLFIPSWGITGAAASTLFAQFISSFYLWNLMRGLNDFRILPRLKNVIGATAAMGVTTIILNLINVHVIGVVMIAGLVYAGMLYFLKEPFLTEAKLLLRPGTSVVEEAKP